MTAAVGSYAYRVKLPRRMRMHNVIHASLLKPYKGNKLGAEGWQLQDPPETASEQYQVHAILDSKKQRGGVVYRIRWVGVMNRHRPGLEPTNQISTEDTPAVELRLSSMLSLTIGDVLSALSLLVMSWF